MKRVTAARIPSGVSLLEVLVSVFVLSVGLLGVASLLPMGRFNIGEAAKDDRSGACGRAALHEIKIRGWLDPEQWLYVNSVNPASLTNPRYPSAPLFPGRPAYPGAFPTSWVPVPFDPRDSVAPNLLNPTPESRTIWFGFSVVIDPLLIISNSGSVPAQQFPFQVTGSAPESLPRVTIDIDPRPGFGTAGDWHFTVMGLAAAQRIFTWHDDRIFSLPDDAQERPRPMVLWDNGEGALVPARATDNAAVSANNTLVAGLADDHYSWMATVTPLVDGIDYYFPPPPNDAVHLSYAERIDRYVVSIVVFYKRNLLIPTGPFGPENMPQERSAVATMVGDGWGGGDVLLLKPKGNPPVAAAWLDVKKNGWLMLRGSQPFWDSGVSTLVRAAKWYRVLAADEIIDGDDPLNTDPSIPAGNWGRYVTLAGPDWRVDTKPPYGTFNPVVDTAYATLVDDVLGVYTTTVQIGRD